MPLRSRVRRGTPVVLMAALGVATVMTSLAIGQTPNEPARSPLSETSVRVDEADITTRSHIARAGEAAAAQQRDEAIDSLLRASDTDGDRLMPLPADPRAPWSEGFAVFVPVRRFAQLQLAVLSARDPELLRVYRRRVDATARRWFDEADRAADLAGLERLVDVMLLSSWGDDALWRASELALERGHFSFARRALEQLRPQLRTPAPSPDAARAEAGPIPPAGRSWWLTLRAAGRLDQAAQFERPVNSEELESSSHWLGYPDSDRAAADVEARAVLVSILAGARNRAEWELQGFRRRHPDAAGHLNGRPGAWSQLLAEWLDASQRWPRPRDRSTAIEPHDGPITLGDMSIEVEPAARPAWTAPLKPWSPPSEPAPPAVVDVASAETAATGARTRTDRERRASLLACHPVVLDGKLVVQDASGIRVLDARTGAAAFPGSDESGLVFSAPLAAEWVNGAAGRLFGLPQFALSHHASHIWARVGRPAFGAESPVGIDAHPSRIVELDLSAEGKVLREIDLPSDANSAADVWVGAPIYHEGHLYAVLRRGDGIETQCHVVCFDAATGRQVWRRFVAAADAARPRRSVDWQNGMLTVHEGRLLVDTQLGAVAALSARNGAIEWLTRYPRQPPDRDQPDDDTRFRRRTLTSCAVHDDLVLVMPPDFPRPFALDLATGQVVWVTSGPVAGDAVHLLGVGADQLIVSGDSLYWFDLATGKSRGQYPAVGTVARGMTRPGAHGLGRGLLTGANVWWPTEDRILIFRQATVPRESGWSPIAVREIPLAPRGASGGNLVLADGMLFIAGPDKLVAFDDAAGLARRSDAAKDTDGRSNGRPASR